jgi:hypothetical protein
MAWEGEVPLLGFEGEYHFDLYYPAQHILIVPVKHYGAVSVYAWHRAAGEGYNIFWPSDTCPVKRDTAQGRDPFTVKMIIQSFLNDVEHFRSTGEIRHGHEVYSSSNGPQAREGMG